jgi:hypothetical protein
LTFNLLHIGTKENIVIFYKKESQYINQYCTEKTPKYLRNSALKGIQREITGSGYIHNGSGEYGLSPL